MSNNTSVNTNGGAFVEGGIITNGDWVGRDQIIHGDIVYGNKSNISIRQESLRHLLDAITGWYNDIIERLHLELVKLKQQGDEQDFVTLGFDYVWRRDYLHKIVALKVILIERGGLEQLVEELDNFLTLLVISRSDKLNLAKAV